MIPQVQGEGSTRFGMFFTEFRERLIKHHSVGFERRRFCAIFTHPSRQHWTEKNPINLDIYVRERPPFWQDACGLSCDLVTSSGLILLSEFSQ